MRAIASTFPWSAESARSTWLTASSRSMNTRRHAKSLALGDRRPRPSEHGSATGLGGGAAQVDPRAARDRRREYRGLLLPRAVDGKIVLLINQQGMGVVIAAPGKHRCLARPPSASKSCADEPGMSCDRPLDRWPRTPSRLDVAGPGIEHTSGTTGPRRASGSALWVAAQSRCDHPELCACAPRVSSRFWPR
jgi:hypothetical protein